MIGNFKGMVFTASVLERINAERKMVVRILYSYNGLTVSAISGLKLHSQVANVI